MAGNQGKRRSGEPIGNGAGYRVHVSGHAVLVHGVHNWIWRPQACLDINRGAAYFELSTARSG